MLPLDVKIATLTLEANRWNYDVLPLREHLEQYRDEGRPLGHFLTALLSKDFAEVFDRADNDNLWLLPIYYAFLYNMMPGDAWGSREKVAAWLAKHRARAMAAETTEVARG